MISRIGGVVVVAVIVGYVIAQNEWWDRDCYDVGEIPGCGGLLMTYRNVVGWASFVASAAGLIAAGVAIARLLSIPRGGGQRGHSGHGDTPRAP